MDLREVMDGLGSGEFADDAVARSRERVLARIATAVPAEAGARRRGTRAADTARSRWSSGALAAAAAVVVVAIVAVGAVLTAQWLGRAPTAGDPDGLDLSAPLLAQLGPGEYLRLATTRESSVTGIRDPDDPESPAADAYLRVRAVDAWYVPADGGAWTIGQPESANELVDQVGPDAAALAATETWRRSADVRTTVERPAVDLGWLQSLPDDADGLIAAFGEHYLLTRDTDDTIAQIMLTDPILVLLTRAQRSAYLDHVGTYRSFTVTEQGEDVVVATSGVLAPARVTFSGPALLPLSGEQDMGWMQQTGAPDAPVDTWTIDLSIVQSVPEPVTTGEAEPEAGGEEPAPGDEDPAAQSPGPDGYWCGVQHIPLAALDAVRYAEDLDADGIAALAQAGVWATIAEFPRSWIVASRTDTEIVLFTDQTTMLAGGWLLTGIPPDHQVTTVIWNGARWVLGSERLCALQHDLGDLDLADVELDPQHLPAPGDAEVRFLVTERACNSGQSAEGRVELVGGTYDGSVLEVTIGIRPTGEPADCSSNPPTPFVLPLKIPWVEGTTVFDMAYVNGRDLTAP